MKTFREWLLETGVVYSNPTNDARYAEKGVRSKREGDQPPAMPGPFKVDPDAMFLGRSEQEMAAEKQGKKVKKQLKVTQTT